MNKNDDRNSGTHFLADLSSYAFDTESLPSIDEARDILSREKIDTAELKSWALESMRGARARQKLAQAEIKRRSMAEKFAAIRDRLTGGVGEMRERVMAKLQVLQNSSPEAAQVYCRKFEEAADEDLPDLEAELLMLDEWDGDEGSK